MKIIDGAGAVAQQPMQPLAAACAHAGRLICDFYARGSRDDPAAAEADDEASMSSLFDEVETAIAKVAAFRALTLNEIASKRELQDLLRPHRSMLTDLLALVGKSIDRDLHQLLSNEGRLQATGQGGWLGWARQSLKGQRPVEVGARETARASV